MNTNPTKPTKAHPWNSRWNTGRWDHPERLSFLEYHTEEQVDYAGELPPEGYEQGYSLPHWTDHERCKEPMIREYEHRPINMRLRYVAK